MSMEKMDLLPLIKSRRSIRKYQDRDVPEDMLQRLIEAAMWAPSSHSSEPTEFIVTKDPDNIARLAELCHAKFIGGAPVVITLVVRPDSGTKSPVMDGSAAAMNLLLEAHALGLGCCWITPYPWQQNLRRALEIPDDWRIIGSFPLGFPAEERAGRRRRTLEEVVHKERYSGNRKQASL